MKTNDYLTLIDNDEQIDKLATALNSLTRRKILRLVSKKSYSIMQIAEILNVSVSNITFHIKLLKAANLVEVIPSPNKRGNEKLVSQGISNVNLDFKSMLNFETQEYIENIPVGSYTNYEIFPPCGLVNENGLIFMHDNPHVFSSPLRTTANLVAFSKGFVEYSVPAFDFKDKIVESFTFSVELCSECPNYNNNWKSDITFWLNGVEICTFRSLGDYGDRRGKYSIKNWPANSTQYGMLKKIRVDNKGTYIDETLTTDVKLADLNLDGVDIIPLRIGIKPNARYVGGVNIFGHNCGDTENDIVVQVCYRSPKDSTPPQKIVK